MIKGNCKVGLPNDMCCVRGEVEIGTEVWVSPMDYPVIRGVVKGFQKIGSNLPIIEFWIEKYGEKKLISSVFDYYRIALVTLAQIREERINKILDEK